MTKKLFGPAKPILVHNSNTGMWEEKHCKANPGDIQLQLVGGALVAVTIESKPISPNWENTPESFLCRD